MIKLEYNKYIDHTLLKSTATYEDITKLCEEAKQYKFASVCIHPTFVPMAKNILANTDVKICTVVGFPLGLNDTKIKATEARLAIKNGADEIDMVMNMGYFKSQRYDLVQRDIKRVKKAVGDKILKVIVETCLLSNIEKSIIANLIRMAKADFIKTSTGFSTSGADVEDIKLFKDILGDSLKIKASGGIKNSKDAISMINAGADRLGTSSGVEIMLGLDSNKEY